MSRSAIRSSDRPYPRARITGGVLAGGRGTRMGGADKGLVEFRGRSMVEYVLERLHGQTARVLVSANRNLDAYRRFGVAVVRDRRGGFQGPLAGVSCLMGAAGSEWLLIAPCDSPHVPADLGPRLWQVLTSADGELAVAHDGRSLEPLFALVPCALHDDLEAYLAGGGRAAHEWLRRHRMAVADFSDCPEAFVNINTSAARDELAARLDVG